MSGLYTILLLLISNIFMTIAWYGHLKYKHASLVMTIFISWGIAIFEYVFQVPANRIGYKCFSAAQLKVMQEVISLSIFFIFSLLYLGEPFKVNNLLGFFIILIGVAVVFLGR